MSRVSISLQRRDIVRIMTALGIIPTSVVAYFFILVMFFNASVVSYNAHCTVDPTAFGYSPEEYAFGELCMASILLHIPDNHVTITNPNRAEIVFSPEVDWYRMFINDREVDLSAQGSVAFRQGDNFIQLLVKKQDVGDVLMWTGFLSSGDSNQYKLLSPFVEDATVFSDRVQFNKRNFILEIDENETEILTEQLISFEVIVVEKLEDGSFVPADENILVLHDDETYKINVTRLEELPKTYGFVLNATNNNYLRFNDFYIETDWDELVYIDNTQFCLDVENCTVGYLTYDAGSFVEVPVCEDDNCTIPTLFPVIYGVANSSFDPFVSMVRAQTSPSFAYSNLDTSGTNLHLFGYWSFDPDNTITAFDLSGNNNHLTYDGTAVKSLCDSGFGYCVDFTGTGGLFINPGINFYDYSASFWFSPNVQLDSSSDRKDFIVHLTSSSEGFGHNGIVFNRNSDGKIEFYLGDILDPGVKTTNTVWNPNQWYHIAVTVGINGEARLYVNGELDASASLSAGNPRTSFITRVGYGRHGSQRYLNAKMDELMMFTEEISASTISKIYNNQVKRFQEENIYGEQLFSDTPENTVEFTVRYSALHNTSVTPTVGFWRRELGYNFSRFEDGLVAYWTGDGNALDISGNQYHALLSSGLQSYFTMDETSGTLAADSVSGFNGTASHERIFTSAVEGIINTGADFTQGNDEIISSGVPSYNFPVTIAGWVRPSGTGTRVILSHDSGANNGFRLLIFNEDLTLTLGGVQTYQFTSLPVPNDEWSFVAVTISGDNGVATAYLNENKQSLNIGTKIGTPDRFIIGARSLSQNYFDGFIDEVGIWNVHLNESQVLSLYNQGAGRILDTFEESPELLNPGAYGQGQYDSAFNFDGTNYVYVEGSDSVFNPQEFSFSFRFKHDQPLGTKGYIITRNRVASTSWNVYHLKIENDHRLRFRVHGTYLDGPVVEPGVWYHAVGTYRSGEWLLYLNGVEVARNNNPPSLDYGTTGWRPFGIGAESSGGTGVWGNNYVGLVDDIKFFDRVLSASEIAELNQYSAVEWEEPLFCEVESFDYIDDLSENRVGYWNLDESSGVLASSLDDYVVGGTEGVIGVAGDFRGGDYIDIGRLSVGTEMSISGWFYLESPAQDIRRGIISKRNNGHGWSINVGGVAGEQAQRRGRLAFLDGNNDVAISDSIINTGEWYHFAVTSDGTTSNIYLNGFLDGTGSGSWSDPDSDINIGRGRPWDNRFFWDGLLDEIAIWDRVLTVQEIQDLANGMNYSSLPSSMTDDLLSYFDFETTEDVHGTNDGTLVSGMTGVANNERVFTLNTGVVNSGIDLTQGNDFLNFFGPTYLPRSTDPLTMSVWVYPFESQPAQAGLFTIERPSSTACTGCTRGVMLRDSPRQFYFWGAGTPGVTDFSPSQQPWVPNKWHHVVFTLTEDSLISLYVDGNFVDSTTLTGLANVPSNYQYYLGIRRQFDQYFNGFIDEVGIWSEALTSEQVTNLYFTQKDKFNNVDMLMCIGPNVYQNFLLSTTLDSGSSNFYTPYVERGFSADLTETPLDIEFGPSIESPPSPVVYEPSSEHNFTTSLITGVASVFWYEWDGELFYDAVHLGNQEYTFTKNNLSAGTYVYRYFAQTSLGDIFQSPSYVYIVEQAPVPLLLDIQPSTDVVYGTTTNATGGFGLDFQEGCPFNLDCILTINGDVVANPHIELLGAGTYTYQYTTAGNQNYSSATATRNLLVRKLEIPDNLTFLINGLFEDVSESFPFGINASVSTDWPDSTVSLFRNGTDITSEINQEIFVLPGFWEYEAVLNNDNHTASKTLFVNISEGFSEVQLFVDNNNNDITVNPGVNISIRAELVAPTTGNVSLYLRGDLIAEGEAPLEIYTKDLPLPQQLIPLGVYEFTAVFDEEGYLLSEESWNVTVFSPFDILTPAYFDIIPAGATVTYSPTATRVFESSWIDDFGVTFVTLNFSNQIYTASTVSGVPFKWRVTLPSPLAAGTYEYRWQGFDGSGKNNITQTYQYVVNQASGSVRLFVNESRSNIVVDNDTTLNISAQRIAGESNVTLLLDGDVICENETICEQDITFTHPDIYGTTYTLTAILPSSQNYTGAVEQWTVSVRDAFPPQLDIRSPIQNRLYESNEVPVRVLVDEPLSRFVVSVDNFVTNVTLTENDPNEWIGTLNLLEGSYTVRFYAVDQWGNVNDSLSRTFFISTDDITECQLLDKPNTIYRVASDLVSTGGDCLVVVATGVTIEGQGFSVTGQGTGRGIVVSATGNSVIRDISVSNFEYGLRYSQSANNFVENADISGVTADVQIAQSFDNTFLDVIYDTESITGAVSMERLWTNRLRILDETSLDPLQGVQAEILDLQGTLLFNGSSGSNGIVFSGPSDNNTFITKQYSYSNSVRTNFTPHTINMEIPGLITGTQESIVNASGDIDAFIRGFFSVPGDVDVCQALNAPGVYTLNESLAIPDRTAGSAEVTCFNIVESDVVFDCQGHTISATDSRNWAISISGGSSNVTVKNCDIEMASGNHADAPGIRVVSAGNDVTITNNNVTGAGYGILVGRLTRNIDGLSSIGSLNITNNNLFENTKYGLFINNVTAQSVFVDGNTMLNNKRNFHIRGTTSRYNQNITYNNLVDTKNLLYNFGVSNTEFNTVTHPNAGVVYCIECDNVIFRNLFVDGNAYHGVYMREVTNSLFDNLRVSRNFIGMEIHKGGNNSLINNQIFNNAITIPSLRDIADGLVLRDSENNFLSGNEISENGFNFVVYDKYNHTILTNNIVNLAQRIYYNYSISDFEFNPVTAPNAGTVYCINCDNVNVTDMNLNAINHRGLFILDSNDVLIRNINSSGNRIGVELYNSTNVEYSHAEIIDNLFEGLIVDGLTGFVLNDIFARDNSRGIVLRDNQDGIVSNFESFLNRGTNVQSNDDVNVTFENGSVYSTRPSQGTNFYMIGGDSNSMLNISIYDGFYGLRVSGGSNFQIHNNTVFGNDHGLFLSSHSGGNLTGNVMYDNFRDDNGRNDNGRNVCIEGTTLNHFNHDISTDNFAQFKEMLYLYGASNQEFTGDYGNVHCANCSNVIFRDMVLDGASCSGAYIFESDGIQLLNITAENNQKGIRILKDSANFLIDGYTSIDSMYGLSIGSLDLGVLSISSNWEVTEAGTSYTFSSENGTIRNVDIVDSSYGFVGHGFFNALFENVSIEKTTHAFITQNVVNLSMIDVSLTNFSSRGIRIGGFSMTDVYFENLYAKSTNNTNPIALNLNPPYNIGQNQRFSQDLKTVFNDTYIERYQVFNSLTTFASIHGEIVNLIETTGSGDNLSHETGVEYNAATIRSFSPFNHESNITLRNLPTNFVDPQIQRNNQECLPPQCEPFTGLNDGNVSFRVLDFSTYSIGEPYTDQEFPVVNILFPLNNSFHNFFLTGFNVEITDDYILDTCWYTLDGGIENITFPCEATEVTGIGTFEGLNTLEVFALDASGKQNSSAHNFIIDFTDPIVDFEEPTPLQGGYNQTYIPFNVSIVEEYPDTVTLFLYDFEGNLVDQSIGGEVNDYFFNFTSLDYGIYAINATAQDKATNEGSTDTRLIVLDAVPSNVDTFFPPDGAQLVSPIGFFANVTDDISIKNVTIFIYNESDLSLVHTETVSFEIGETNDTVVPFIVDLPTGDYAWQILAVDWAGHESISDPLKVVSTVEAAITVTLGPGLTAIRWRVPFLTEVQALDVRPTGQTDVVPLFVATNAGTGEGSINLRFNDTYPGVLTYCADNHDFNDEVLLTTSYQPIANNVGPSDSVNIWCRRDYVLVPATRQVSWQFALLGPVFPDD